MDVREQRVRFVVAALRRERSFSSLCREFGISRPTGRLWLERYRAGGVEAIAERSRQPLHSPRQTAPELEQRVIQLRLRYPDWGARKLQVLLGQDGMQLPASTIHRILLRHHLVQEEDRHRPAQQRFERAAPNELWQMDFKGPKSWHQPIGPLSVLDDHSRYVIALEALGSTHAGPVRTRLEEAFVECGVPQAMLMDHGVPWWSWAGPQAATTGLALWLMKQGIQLHWSGIGHPQTQGKVERFHGALQRALTRRGLSGQSPQHWLDGYRWEHNYLRPHEALGMQTPASRWRPSPRRYDPNPPRWQYPEGAWVLKVDCQGKLDIADTKWRIGRALAGEWVQVLQVAHRLQVYYCNTLVRELQPAIHGSTIVARWIPIPAIEGGRDGGPAALENAARFPLSLPPDGH
jgi:transposase InsO family protein